MLKELFSELYEKLKKEEKNDSQKISGCFVFFVERILEEKYNKVNIVSSRTLTNYYNKYVEGKENNAGEPKNDLKNIIANYLDFKDYADFQKNNISSVVFSKKSIDEHKKNKENNTSNTIGSKEKVIIGTSVMLVLSIGYFILNTFSYNSCIIWQSTHFKKSTCNTKKAIDNSIYNINVDKFLKVRVTKNTIFFKDGVPLIWYGKNSNKEMEFFTDRGIHPETLKELKPITEIIINNYVIKNKADKTILK